MRYLRLFDKDVDYQSLIASGGGIELPNVSHTVDANKVYYSPYVPQPSNEIWYTSTDGNVVVPNNTNFFGESNSNALQIISNTYEDSLGKITFGGIITFIGYQAFYNCSGLTNIEIPSGVTSIGLNAFYGCSGLTSINIPSGVTSIRNYTFYGCSGLTSIEIPNGVTSIGTYAFYGCSGLTSINIPSGVTSIRDYTFYGCSGLTSIEIPSGVTSIGTSAFSNCSGLTSIEIPSGVTSIGYNAFRSCRSLKTITILATTPPSLRGYALNDVDSSIKIYVPSESVDAYKTATEWSTYANIIQAIA